MTTPLRSYAIGDIHGHLDLLHAAHALIAADRLAYPQPPSEIACARAPAPVIHLGDLVDRGPDSAGVVEYLLQGQAQGQPWLVLKGNHDRLFERFIADPAEHDPGLRAELNWIHPRLGGIETLASYGVADAGARPLDQVIAEARAAVPLGHLGFLRTLPTSLLRGEVLFVHAGIRPGIDLRDQIEDDLVWIRKPFLEDRRDHGPLVVHGHTAIDQATHYGNRVNLDSSAAYGGPLTAVVIEGRDIWRLSDQGRVALPQAEPVAP